MSFRPSCIFRHAMLIGACCLAASAAPGQAGREKFSSLPARWKLPLLPGCDQFTFAIYGCPKTLPELQALVARMKQRGLANGFDPGPVFHRPYRPLFEYLATVGWPVVNWYGGAIGTDQEQLARILDAAGVFTAVQVGEWSGVIHDQPPQRELEKCTTKRECYRFVRNWYQTRNAEKLGRALSVTGHSHYEAYAAEWGTKVIGVELAEHIAYTQSKIAFARGAARQWRLPWSAQISPWFGGACTSSGPLRLETYDPDNPHDDGWRGLDAGHSLSLARRMWLHAWFAGAAMVTPENSISSFFQGDPKNQYRTGPPWNLSPHGEAAAEAFAFMRDHDRGTPWTPVAIVLDHYTGWIAYRGRTWGRLEYTDGDKRIRDLFREQLFPGSDHIHQGGDPANPEATFLRPTPYGEMFDVLLSSAKADTLGAYPVVLLVGDVEFGSGFVCQLQEALRGGTRVLLHRRHAEALGEHLDRLRIVGAVEVLEEWTHPKTGLSAAISADRLDSLAAEYLPVHVAGDPVQYQVNRNRRGWVVELVHNGGVVKFMDKPAVVDPADVARVTVRCKTPVRETWLWRVGRPDEKRESTETVSVTVGPGENVYVEFVVE